MIRPGRTLSRRGLLAGAGGFAAAGLLAACGDNGSGTAKPTDPSDGPWSFTDDRGTKISLPRRPERLVCQTGPAAALWDYGIASVGLFGPQTRPDGRNELEAGSLDLAKLTTIGGAVPGDFDLEQYTALEPDALITTVSDDKLSYVPDRSLERIGQVAPIVALQAESKNLPDMLTRFVDLAVSLGVRRDAGVITQPRTDFESASEVLRKTTVTKPGLKVLAVSATKDEIRFAKPKHMTDLTYFKSLGVEVVEPGGMDEHWEVSSWERADRYPADLILYDARGYEALPLAEVQQMPTWQQLPAVRAGQVQPWKHLVPPSYRQTAVAVRDLTTIISRSRADLA